MGRPPLLESVFFSCSVLLDGFVPGVIRALLGRRTSSSTLLSSSVWAKNSVDRRESKRRKIKQKFSKMVYRGETQENGVIYQNGRNPRGEHHLQPKTKGGVGSRALELQKGERPFTGRWKSQCLVNKCVTTGRQWGAEWTLISGPCRVLHAHLLACTLCRSASASSLLTGLCNSFRERKVRVSESLGL